MSTETCIKCGTSGWLAFDEIMQEKICVICGWNQTQGFFEEDNDFELKTGRTERLKYEGSLANNEDNKQIVASPRRLTQLEGRKARCPQMESNKMDLNNKQITIDGNTYVLQLVGASSGSRSVTVSGIVLKDGMKKIDIEAPIIDDWKLHTFTQKNGDEGKVHSFLIGGDGGAIKIAVWGDLTDNVKSAKKDSTLVISNAYCKMGKPNKEGKEFLELHVGQYSMIGVLEDSN